ncbi:MAG: polyhydroxyalkanoate depolymerase [Pseudomonadota bacterium]
MFPALFPTTGRATWMYAAYELAHASTYPARTFGRSVESYLDAAVGPFGASTVHPAMRAGWRVVDELTQRYAKPEFGIDSVEIDGVEVSVTQETVLQHPFCTLKRFVKSPAEGLAPGPKVLLLAPMSGHFATLLRGTVRAMVPRHDVHITDWADARSVPLYRGRFDLDDYIDYLLDYFRALGPDLHVIAVCQPSVPALAATALLAEDDDPGTPTSLTLIAGPVDTARNPTAVNEYSQKHDLTWFRNNVITLVPFPHLGAMRAVYPGFLQLAGFMGMNAGSHVQAYQNYFEKLIAGDEYDVTAHRRFYDEYLAVMDITAEYFLQTVDRVFQRRLLAQGQLEHRGRRVDCRAIKRTSLMTIEGERDDICGIGQTQAAHDLCSTLDDSQRDHYVQPGAGHYGVFNGRRWREEIQPRISRMIGTSTA